jgi:polar amino acid transport system permease protein
VLRTRKVRITVLDIVILAVLAAAAAYLGYRITTGIHYRWNWKVIPQYLFRFDAETERWVPNLLMQGLFTTIRLSLWSTLLAMLLGTIMGLWRVSASLFKRLTGGTYVELVRNLPPLVLVFIFYYFVSDQIMPVLGVEEFVRACSSSTQTWLNFFFAPPARFAAFMSAVITLAFYEGAYITEIVRAGVQSIERGQWEASYGLGLTWWQQMRHVILPQALQRTLPPLAGQFISAIKDSAIVSVISIPELTFQGMELMAAAYVTFEVWITITLMYCVLTFGCSLAVGRLEKHLRRSEA